jgi:hypothetical protein
VALVASAWAVPITAGMVGSAWGAGSTPPGTIYIAGSPVYSIDGAGGSKTTLGANVGWGMGRASRLLHGGRRWFLASQKVTGEDGPGRATSRFDLFAVRADGAYSVRLTSEAAMEYRVGAFDFAPDENASGATITMFARLWTGLAATDTVVPGTAGLYTAHLSFDATGNAVGFDAAPAYFVSVGTVSTTFGEDADANGLSWSPDMTKIALDRKDGSVVRVLDVASGASTTIVTHSASDTVGSPNWSPDGARIAYGRSQTDLSGNAIETVTPSGAGRLTLVSVKAKHSWVSPPPSVTSAMWSPDSAYVAYGYVPEGGLSKLICRVSATGTGKVTLLDLNAWGAVGPIDWR